mmetsp:Transcript_13692/g.20092  ORF Transcript_13692/g.20092 Transcript_13692/m.20092 type:complete len:127 (-) Transcript_13692:28-408(-)
MESLVDAALLLRTNGLLSILTYPGTNVNEANAVSYFCEGLVLFTAREENRWKRFVESIPPDADVVEEGNDVNEEASLRTFAVRDIVTASLQRVFEQGSKNQTWRSFRHEQLGRPLSPILVTAIKIK